MGQSGYTQIKGDMNRAYYVNVMFVQYLAIWTCGCAVNSPSPYKACPVHAEAPRMQKTTLTVEIVSQSPKVTSGYDIVDRGMFFLDYLGHLRTLDNLVAGMHDAAEKSPDHTTTLLIVSEEEDRLTIKDLGATLFAIQRAMDKMPGPPWGVKIQVLSESWARGPQ